LSATLNSASFTPLGVRKTKRLKVLKTLGTQALAASLCLTTQRLKDTALVL
jgi:hypothetical protein